MNPATGGFVIEQLGGDFAHARFVGRREQAGPIDNELAVAGPGQLDLARLIGRGRLIAGRILRPFRQHAIGIIGGALCRRESVPTEQQDADEGGGQNYRARQPFETLNDDTIHHPT
jgi:hypothetical protein